MHSSKTILLHKSFTCETLTVQCKWLITKQKQSKNVCIYLWRVLSFRQILFSWLTVASNQIYFKFSHNFNSKSKQIKKIFFYLVNLLLKLTYLFFKHFIYKQSCIKYNQSTLQIDYYLLAQQTASVKLIKNKR